MSSRVRLIYRPPGGGLSWGRKAFLQLMKAAQSNLSEGAYAKLTNDLLTDPRLTRVPLWQRALTIKQRYSELIPGKVTAIRERRGLRSSWSQFRELLRRHGIPPPRRPAPQEGVNPSPSRSLDMSRYSVPSNSRWGDWTRMSIQARPPVPGSPASEGSEVYSTYGDGFGIRHIWEGGAWYSSQLRDRDSLIPVRFLRRDSGNPLRSSDDPPWRQAIIERSRAQRGRPAPAPEYTPPRIGVYR